MLLCSIPEVTQRGGETRARIVMANAQLKKLCKRRRIRFLDLTANGLDNHFSADGVSYGSGGIRRVVEQMVTPIARFLGVAARRSKGQPATLSTADDLKTSQDGPHATGNRRPECNHCAARQAGKAQRNCKQYDKQHPNRKTSMRHPELRRPNNWKTKTQDPGQNVAPAQNISMEARIKEIVQEHLNRRWPTLGPAWGQMPTWSMS